MDWFFLEISSLKVGVVVRKVRLVGFGECKVYLGEMIGGGRGEDLVLVVVVVGGDIGWKSNVHDLKWFAQ